MATLFSYFCFSLSEKGSRGLPEFGILVLPNPLWHLVQSLFKCYLFGNKVSLLIYILGFSYIVPEYSFLDARGLGAYEGKNLESVSEVGLCLSSFLGLGGI